MMRSRLTKFRWFGVWIAIAFAIAAEGSLGAEITVSAGLTRNVVAVGEPVQLQIKIDGARRAGEPPEVAVEGLEIRYLGPAQNSAMRIQNGAFTAQNSVTHIYEVTPARSGTFAIPSVRVDVDGKTFKTEPVGLTVQKSDPGADGAVRNFAELNVEKKGAYVGEAVPAEVRLYIDVRLRNHWQPETLGELAGEGFTKHKIPKPEQPKEVNRDGRAYDMLVFKTAITPSRAGAIRIGPTEVLYAAQVPRARRSGPRSLLDAFGDDLFADPFFAPTQHLKARAEPVELTVKPLPAAGRPGDFSGAVGRFEFSAEGSPTRVKVGDPITMKLRVSGQGNFDRVAAPVLKDEAGWRVYPPGSSFAADDDVGISGTKTFEIAVSPEVKKTVMPAFAFSYFDPMGAKYVTLTNEPSALVVEGGAAPASQKPVGAESSLDAAPRAMASPQAPGDILGLRYDMDAKRASFGPLWERREFWVAQGLPAAAFLVFLAWRSRRAPDARAARIAMLRRERATAVAKLRSEKIGEVEFLESAARVIQIDTALATGADPENVDAAAAIDGARLDGETARVVEEIFDARGEALYAGMRGGAGGAGVDRTRVFSALEKISSSHATR